MSDCKPRFALWRITTALTIVACSCPSRALPQMAPSAAPALSTLSAQALAVHVQDTPKLHLIAYLFAGKSNNFTELAKRMQFGKITELNLAFATPPQCDGGCTASSDMHFSIDGETDADIDRMVAIGHAAGVKVLASIGGGGGDQRIIAFYNAGLSAPLVASLNSFVKAHQLDGVDLDIEDPSNMGAPFLEFTNALTATLHPQGKLVTAAVAKYLQASMPDGALRQFDLLNVMCYSSYSSAKDELEFYAVQKKIAPAKLVLGVPFFGSNQEDSREEGYKDILAAYPNAWKVDMSGGGLLDDGQVFHFVGEATMALETQLSKQYGGVMLWDLTDDAPEPHSLRVIIERNF